MTHTLDIPAPADTTTDTMRAAVSTPNRRSATDFRSRTAHTRLGEALVKLETARRPPDRRPARGAR